MMLAHSDQRLVLFERGFAAFLSLFFVYAVLDWRGLVPGEPSWRPLNTVLLAGALLAQSLGSLAARRSRVLQYMLLTASIALLVLVLRAR